MTYIVRLDLGRNHGGVRYGTVDDDVLHVTYQPKLREKRRSPLGFREMEQVGVDRSRVWLRFSSNTFVNDRGTKGLYPGNTQFRLLERHQHVRRLSPDAMETLARCDDEIKALAAQIDQLREARRHVVQALWRGADKVDINDLEERANEHVKA